VAIDMLFGQVKLGTSPSATVPKPVRRKRATLGTMPSGTPRSKYAGSPPSITTTTTGRDGQRYVTPFSSTPSRSIGTPFSRVDGRAGRARWEHTRASSRAATRSTRLAGRDESIEPRQLFAGAQSEELIAASEREASGRAHQRIPLTQDGENGGAGDPADVEVVERPSHDKTVLGD